MTDAARTALAVNEAFSALGNELFQAEGATFVRNREIPDIWDANHVAHITAATPDEIDGLLARVDREFAGFRHRQYRVDFTTPPAFEARLVLEGFERDETLVMLLEGGLNGTAKPCEIRTVESEADWNAYTALHDIDWREYRERMPGGPVGFDEGTAAQMMRSRRSMSPPVRHWLACVNSVPRAYLSSWGGLDGVGIEDLFTHPEFRHRGLATALIHHGMSEARREGAGPIVIGADTKDTPKRMYAALGFRPVALKRDYMKRPGP